MKAWLTGCGVINKLREELSYTLTLKDDSFSVRFIPEIGQAHIILSRETLIAIREAIDKEIPNNR